MSHDLLIDNKLNELVARMEGGDLSWKKTWIGGGIPVNYTTGAEYHGINVLLLWLAAEIDGYPTNEWATYRQWKEKGFQVEKGQKGTSIILARPAVANKGTDDERVYNLFKSFSVFNAAQLIEPPPLDMPDPFTLEEKHYIVTKILEEHKVQVIDSNRAAYNWTDDVLKMPSVEKFFSGDAYCATLLHELVHWTGHKSRLDRDLSGEKKSNAYAFEELIAELGSAFLCARFGIDGETDNHAAYLQGWSSRFGDDAGRQLLLASKEARLAYEFLLDKPSIMDKAA